jgi:ABC-type nickel/cobalt efflux system permease component RcnA
MIETVFLAVAMVGLLHRVEPGHGWPVAALFAIRSERPIRRALLSSTIISFFHLLSSVAVVAAYAIVKALTGFTIPYLNLIAGLGLAILGFRFLVARLPKEGKDHVHYHEDFGPGEHTHEHKHTGGERHSHPHSHARRLILSVSGLAAFAFVLGFAHEEEFALLALAVGGIDPLALMLTYAAAVTAALVGITCVSVSIIGHFEHQFRKYEHLIPKVSGIILLLMAATFLAGLR